MIFSGSASLALDQLDELLGELFPQEREQVRMYAGEGAIFCRVPLFELEEQKTRLVFLPVSQVALRTLLSDRRIRFSGFRGSVKEYALQ